MSRVRPTPWQRTGWKPAPNAAPAVVESPPSQVARDFEALLRSLCGLRRLLRVDGDARRLEVVLPSGDAVELRVSAGRTAQERAVLGSYDPAWGVVTVAPGPFLDPDGEPSTVGAALDAADRARKMGNGE